MERRSALRFYLLFWIFGAAFFQACAPLTSGSNSTSSCMAGAFSNTEGVALGQAGVTIPGGFLTATTNQLGQSFLANSSTSISTLSLNLNVVLAAGTTALNSSVTVNIEEDSSVTASNTPTVPNGMILASATVQTSTIPIQTAQYIAFDFSSPFSLSPGKIYWIVASSLYGTDSTSFVEWRAGPASSSTSLAAYFGSSWLSFPSALNLDFKIGC